MRVLVVEDDKLVRNDIVALLRKRGHHVTECGAAEPALAIHQTMPFPLILLDWVLPGMDGLEMCRRARHLPGGDSPVIIIATSRDRPEDLIAGLDAGADDYLPKPITANSMTTRLAIAERTVLERARRELTEEALLSSEASFRALIEGSPDGILAHRDGRIAYANPALLKKLGYESAAELVGRTFLGLVHDDDSTDTRERIELMLTSGSPSPAREVRLLTRNGVATTMEEVAIPLDFDGHPAIAAVFRDIAERKRLEQQLIMADRMVSVGTLAAGIAHEINNPLAYVLSNLDFIKEELASIEDIVPAEKMASMRNIVDQTDDGAQRVRVIVRDLKSFSRGDDEGETTEDIHRMLDGAISMAWNEIRHRAELVKQYGSVPPIQGNEARLGQVVLNLLINAAQALPVGKATENRITIRTLVRGEHVNIEIEDTGPGIPEEDLNRIFDPFYTTKPVGEGVGLGLSICHNIVTSAGGEITVDTRKGSGTIFRVSLKTSSAIIAPRNHSLRPRTTSYPTGLRILIIDDEPSVGRALARALRGHKAELASSGHEALERLSQDGHLYDIVFCDLMMAEMSGMELFDRVKATMPDLKERFVFMTGGAFTARAREFIQEVACPVLEKPFQMPQLQKLVASACRTNSDLAPEVVFLS